MTGQSLFYMGAQNLKHKILAIAEEEGAERASYALKLLQSEGELTIASTGKDPQSGRHVTQEYHVEGPVMIMLTTTAIDIDEELLNRCMVLTVDEGHAQTERIHQAQRRGRTLAGRLAHKRYKAILRRHRNAQRLLRPVVVVNPFAEELTFFDHKTRFRRDHAKYLTLIETIALLHQHQRPLKSVVQDGERLEYIEVVRSDIAAADKLFSEILKRALDELPPQTRRLLERLEEEVVKLADSQGTDAVDVRFTRRDVRAWTQMGNTQVHTHLGRLEELEYVLGYRTGVGRRMVYRLLTQRVRPENPSAFREPFGAPLRKVFPNDDGDMTDLFGLSGVNRSLVDPENHVVRAYGPAAAGARAASS